MRSRAMREAIAPRDASATDSERRSYGSARTPGGRCDNRSLPIAASCLAAAFAVSHDAFAQHRTGWTLDRFDPTPAGDAFFTADFPLYARGGAIGLRAALTFDYALDPLLARTTSRFADGRMVVPIVEHLVVGHAQAGVQVYRRLSFDVAVPVYLFQSGQTEPGVPLAAASDPRVGDIRLGVRARIVGEPDASPVSLHLGLYSYLGFLGYNRSTDNSTDGSARLKAYATVSGRARFVRWSVSVGYHARPSTEVFAAGVGSELFCTAAIGVVAVGDRLVVGPEVNASTVAARAFQPFHNSAEIMLGAHYRIAGPIVVGAGLGAGLTGGLGTPAMRGLVSIALVPEDGVDPAGSLHAHSESTATRNTRPSTEHTDAQRTSPARWCDRTDGCVPQDPDGDGVFGEVDACPDLPAGAFADPVRAGCPAADSDHDGVPDASDECSTEVTGPHADPRHRGCPLHDRDGDNVPDDVDHCPETPGAPNSDPSRNGCAGLVRFDSDSIRVVEPVNFATGRAEILSRSDNVLAAVAEVLRTNPEIRRISIDGHTDDSGSEELNIDLSQRRAIAVMLWLVAHQIDPMRLEAHGYGATRPIRPIAGLTAAQLTQARAVNRRVEFRVINPSTSHAP